MQGAILIVSTCAAYFKPDNRQRHCVNLATTGAGKTNVAQVSLLRLLEAGIPFLVIDWKRAYADLKTLDHPLVKNIEVYSVGRKTRELI